MSTSRLVPVSNWRRDGSGGPAVEDLIAAEGWQCVVPDAESADDALGKLRAADDWDEAEERKLGIMAMRVREARRKEADY